MIESCPGLLAPGATSMGHPPEEALSRASAGPRRLTPGSRALLAAILAVHVLLFFLLHANFDHDYDAQHYARIAHELSAGEFQIALHPFTHRLAVTVPTALCYRLLGVGRLTTTLWPLAASLATIVLTFALARRLFGRGTALLAAFLLAANLVQAKYSSRLLPDIVVSMFLFAGLVLLTDARETGARETGARGHQRRDGLLCALALTGAFLAKSTFFWSLPFFLIVLARDLIRREHLRFWAWFTATGLAAAALYFGAYHLATGNALYRLEAIEATHNVREWSYAMRSASELLARLTYEPAQYFIARPGYGLLLLASLPALVHAVRPLRVFPRQTRWIAGYFAVVFLAFWFGTTSLVTYNPLPIAERFLMPLLAPLCILSAVTIRGLVLGEGDAREKRPGLLLLGGAFLLGAAAILPSGVRRSLLYAAFLLPTLTLLLDPLVARLARRRVRRAIEALAVLLLFLTPVLDHAARGDPYESPPLLALERKVFAEQLAELGEPTVILTDAHSVFALPFHYRAGVPDHVRFADWSDGARHAEYDTYRRLAYIHQPRLIAMHGNWGQEIPDYAFEQPEGWTLIDAQTIDGEYWILVCEVPRDE